MYALYYFPGNASLLPHMMLREIGARFELRLVDRANNEQKSPDYLRLNPNGRIPVLSDGELTLYETAAIALHLCDRHPDAGLAPESGTRERSMFYRWLVHLTNTPQAEYRAWFYPHEFTTDEAGVPAVKGAAEARLNGIFDCIDAQLGSGPWLLGERFSAADLYLLMMIRWAGRCLARRARFLGLAHSPSACWRARRCRRRSRPRALSRRSCKGPASGKPLARWGTCGSSDWRSWRGARGLILCPARSAVRGPRAMPLL